MTEAASALEGRQAYLPLSVGLTEETSSVEAEREVGWPPWPRVGGDVSTVTPPRGDV